MHKVKQNKKIEILFWRKFNVIINFINSFKMFSSMPFVSMNLVRAPHNLHFWSPSRSNETIPIKYLTLNEFHYAIRQALSNQHSITKFEWDEKSKAYKIEYGTRPLEYDNIECAGIIQRKRYVAGIASFEARRRFQHDEEDEVDWGELVPILMVDLPRSWSKFEFRLYWNHQENCIQVCGQRLTGDRMAYFDVWRRFDRYFRELETKQRNLREAALEGNTEGCVSEEYLREYLVCDLV